MWMNFGARKWWWSFGAASSGFIFRAVGENKSSGNCSNEQAFKFHKGLLKYGDVRKVENIRKY